MGALPLTSEIFTQLCLELGADMYLEALGNFQVAAAVSVSLWLLGMFVLPEMLDSLHDTGKCQVRQCT